MSKKKELGNSGVTEQMMMRVRSQAYQLAHRIGRPDFADDLAQEVFLQWEKNGFTSNYIKSDVIDAARKLFGDSRGASAKPKGLAHEVDLEHAAQLAHRAPGPDLILISREVLKELPVHSALILYLYYVCETPLTGIANCCGRTPGWASRELVKARRALEIAKG